MKIIKSALVTVLLLGTLTVHAKAQEHGVNGLFVRAGNGALVGQATGRDGEATLLGTAVGGMLGYMIGSETDKDGYGRRYGLVHPVFFIPPVPRRVFPHDSDKICREFVVTESSNGKFREVTKTECRDRDWRGDDRNDWRDDDRRQWRDDHGYQGQDNQRNDWRDDRRNQQRW